MSEASEAVETVRSDGELKMPHGYVLAHGGVATEQKSGPVVFYPASLGICSLGMEANTGVEVVEVQFGVGDEIRRVVLERSALATVRGLVAGLAAHGAYVHDENARKVMAYLNGLIAENYASLPRYKFTEHLGTQSDGSIVLPHVTVGGNARYTGSMSCHLGSEQHAYEDALRQIAGWEGAWPLWTLVGWSLISPFLRRLNVGRNPVVAIQGGSNVGKTTTALFAQGVWSGNREAPFLTQGTASTAKGLLQTLEALRDLPGTIDEVHTAPLEEHLEGVVYGYANRQSYSRGAVDGKVWGGGRLHGFLIMCGEASLETRFSGAANRILQIDADTYPPLGKTGTRGSEIGKDRADFLDDAWQRGAGHLGPRVAKDILANWLPFTQKISLWQEDTTVRQCGDWAHRIAVLMGTLEMLSTILDISLPREVYEIPARLFDVLDINRRESSPHVVAWDKVCTFLLQCTEVGLPSDTRVLQYRGELVGWIDEKNINLLSGAPELLGRIGSSAVQRHGKRWVQEGWVVPDPKGQATWSRYFPGKGKTARVLVIARNVVESE